jgi:Fe-S-cluster containining protein
MKAVITLFTKQEQSVNVTMDIPGGSITLDELVVPFRELYHHIISLEIRGKKVTCKKGCAACCVQMIPLSIPEVFFLDTLITTMSPDQKKRVKKRFARNKNRLQDAGLLEGLKDPRAVRTLDEPYFQLGLECPFLESGRCSIYDDRPFVCREYYVVSPKELCTSPYTTPPRKVEIGLNIGALLSSFAARFLGLSSTPVPHIIAPDWADRFKQIKHKRFPTDQVCGKIFDVLSTVKPGEGSLARLDVSLEKG